MTYYITRLDAHESVDDYDIQVPKGAKKVKSEPKESEKLTEKGKVKFQSLDYIQNLAFHLKKIVK